MINYSDFLVCSMDLAGWPSLNSRGAEWFYICWYHMSCFKCNYKFLEAEYKELI